MTQTLPGEAIGRHLKRLEKTIALDETHGHLPESDDFGRDLTEQAGVFEIDLRRYVDIFDLAVLVMRIWRTAVFEGSEPPSEEIDAGFLDVFSRWLRCYTSHFRERTEFYARHRCRIDAGLLGRLAESVREAESLLRNWLPAKPAKSAIFRPKKIDGETATRIEQVLGRLPTPTANPT